MKTLKMIGLALLFALVASTSFAAGSTDLTVQANVLGTCSFDAAAYTMDFGNLDPAAAVNTNITTQLGFTCSNGTGYTIDDISGASTMAGVGDNLPYSIALYTLAGTGTGATQTVDLIGTVLAADYDIASGRIAQAYSSTVTININP